MLKPMLLATSMLFAVPAFAQETPAQDNTQPAQTAPAQAAPATAPVQEATPPVTDDKAPGTQDQTADAAPVEPATQPTQPAQGVAQDTTTATPTQPAEAVAAATPEPAAATPAATQEQVAQAVGRDFGGYDKNADGKLDATEFAAWIGNLRKAAEPGFQPGSAEATTWSNQAFASADTDKSASVNKQELTVFLTPKQPS